MHWLVVRGVQIALSQLQNRWVVDRGAARCTSHGKNYAAHWRYVRDATIAPRQHQQHGRPTRRHQHRRNQRRRHHPRHTRRRTFNILQMGGAVRTLVCNPSWILNYVTKQRKPLTSAFRTVAGPMADRKVVISIVEAIFILTPPLGAKVKVAPPWRFRFVSGAHHRHPCRQQGPSRGLKNMGRVAQILGMNRSCRLFSVIWQRAGCICITMKLRRHRQVRMWKAVTGTMATTCT